MPEERSTEAAEGSRWRDVALKHVRLRATPPPHPSTREREKETRWPRLAVKYRDAASRAITQSSRNHFGVLFFFAAKDREQSSHVWWKGG